MTWPRLSLRRGLAGWLAAGVCLSIASLTWFGSRAITGWQRSASLLTERRANDIADLVLIGLSRDMRGVQSSVLSSPAWNPVMLDPPYGVTSLVSAAFARYPYPNAFFAWRGAASADQVAWFTRADRPPVWSGASPPPVRFPVVIGRAPDVAAALLERIHADVAEGRLFSVFEIPLGGHPHQVIVRLLYRDAYHEQLDGAFGFTVDLDWARRSYFPELTREVARVAGATGIDFTLGLVDGNGVTVSGSRVTETRGALARRSFPVMFFDPWIVALDPPRDLARTPWSLDVHIETDPTLAGAVAGTSRTLMAAALAAGSLALGLVLTARAARASATLAEIRSEFVATVTHELKTPIAAIRAAGDTLARGRVTRADDSREYAELIVQESKRLTRLVDNVLAYARVTDVAERREFEAVDLRDVVAQVARDFQAQLTAGGFELDVDVPAGTPPVLGEPAALGLALENLVDNAIRYSGGSRALRVAARPGEGHVVLEVADRGIGIPEDEIEQVTRRFYRGRGAPSGGSGLGLAIVRRIIETHGGSLAIRSIVGGGTTVSVSLPVAHS